MLNEDVDEDTDSEDSMDSDDTEESENPFIQYFENQGFFQIIPAEIKLYDIRI